MQEIQNQIIHKGKIVFYNSEKNFGFIESPSLEKAIFFYAENYRFTKTPISILDNVNFSLKEVKIGKHQGSIVVNNLKFSSSGDLSQYDRRIGVLYNCNDNSASIKYPTQGKEIFVLKSRLLYNSEFNHDELIVFCPIKSKNTEDKLFAFFAYELKNEKNIDFLIENYKKHPLLGLKNYILSILNYTQEQSFDVLLELKLADLTQCNTLEFIQNIKEFLIHIKKQYNYCYSWQTIKSLIPTTNTLFDFFQQGLLNDYQIDDLINAFLQLNQEQQQNIYLKLPVIDAEKILRINFDKAIRQPKKKDIEQDLAQILNILNKYNYLKSSILYSDIIDYVNINFNEKQILKFWNKGYVSELPDHIITNTNFVQDLLDQLMNEKYTDNVITQSVRLILSTNFEQVLKHTLYDLIYITVKLFDSKSALPPKHRNLIKAVKDHLNNHICTTDKFYFKLFNIEIEFDINSYVQENVAKLSSLDLLIYWYNYRNTTNYFPIQTYINLDALTNLFDESNWNYLIYPVDFITTSFNENYGPILTVNELVDKFTEEQNYNNPFSKLLVNYNLNNPLLTALDIRISQTIRKSTNKNKIADVYYIYRSAFKKLQPFEQLVLKHRLNAELLLVEITVPLMEATEPCTNYQHLPEECYYATCSNIYFNENTFQLRLEDGSFSKKYTDEFSSIAFNSLPLDHLANKVIFEIKLKNKAIESITNLDVFYKAILGDVEHVSLEDYQLYKDFNLFNITQNKDILQKQYIEYAEDWGLRKKILSYLDEASCKACDFVSENEFENANQYYTPSKQTSALFTITTNNGYALIWENTDYTPNKATYVFKCTKQELVVHTDMLVNIIQNQKYVRSALHNDNSGQFKKIMGCVARLTKERGVVDAYTNWINKFKIALDSPTPIVNMPDRQQAALVYLEAYSKTINQSTTLLNQSAATIKENELDTMSVFDKNSFASKNNSNKTDIVKKIADKQQNHTLNLNQNTAKINKQKNILDLLTQLNTLIDNASN